LFAAVVEAESSQEGCPFIGAIYRRSSSRSTGLVVGQGSLTWGPLGLILHQMLLCFVLKQNSMAVSALSLEKRPERCMVLGSG